MAQQFDIDSVVSPRRAGPALTLAVIFIASLFLAFSVFSMWRSIAPGYVGIVFDKYNHNVTAAQLEPGWAFINPFTQAIREYPITIKTYSMVWRGSEGSVRGDDSLKVQSNEGQQLNLDVVIQYQVKKEEAAALYQDWGGAGIETVEDGVIRQYTRSYVPAVASKYSWEEITSAKREEIIKEIGEVLGKEFASRHLHLVSFGIREVHLPAALQSALDQKIQAQQLAEQQRYQLKQAEVRAQQDVTVATGQANALKAQAEGEAAATLTRAKSQAEANQLLARSLTSELINYRQLEKWNGQLPVVTGGSVPLMDLSKFAGGKGTNP